MVNFWMLNFELWFFFLNLKKKWKRSLIEYVFKNLIFCVFIFKKYLIEEKMVLLIKKINSGLIICIVEKE